MEGNRGRSTIGMTKLFVRAALTYLDETKRGEDRDDLAGLKNRNARHSIDDDGLGADELGLELRFAVLKQHRDHLTQICVQFIERCALAVRARESRHVAHVELCIGAVFDHGSIGRHGAIH